MAYNFVVGDREQLLLMPPSLSGCPRITWHGSC